MSRKIRRYSVPTLFSICVVLLLSLLIFHAADSAFAQTFSPTVTPASGTGERPHAATDGYGFVYLTYEKSADSVYFRKSSDSGTTFPDPVVNVGSEIGYFPRIAINNDENAYVIYSFLFGGNYFPKVFKSTHNGAYNFAEKLDGSSYGASYQGAQSLSQNDIRVEVISGVDNVYAVSEDNVTDTGNWHIYFWWSDDGGSTWQSGGNPSAISANPDARYPALAVRGSGSSDVYAAWVRITNGHIMFNHSTDAGSNWQVADLQISDSGASVQNQRPGLAASSSTEPTDPKIFAVWTDSRNGNNDVYFSFCYSAGSTWEVDGRLGNISYIGHSQDQPSIAAVKLGTTHLYVAWRDTRNGTSHIYFQEATWTGSAFRWGIDLDGDGTVESGSEEGIDLRVNENSSGAEDTPTVIASANGEVYVTWYDAGASIKCARYNLGPGAAPGAPTNLTAAAGNGKVDLDWDDNTEADFSSYKVYRSTTRGQWEGFLVEGVTDSEYEDGSAVNGTCYWYVVTAVDTEGFESNYSNDAHATPNVADTTEPAAPTALTAAAGNLQASLSWTVSTSTDVSGYHIYRSTVSGSGYSYVFGVNDPTAFYTDTGLVAGVKYYYVVTAVDTSNNESSDSNEANAAPLDESGQVVSPPAEFPAGPGLLRTSDGDCFIATAAYGTPLAVEVRILSRLRDNVLLSSGAGRQFVKAYQKLSPPLAGFVSEKPLIKSLVRMQLKPWVKIAKIVISVSVR